MESRRVLLIEHLSDLHFGKRRVGMALAAGGGRAPRGLDDAWRLAVFNRQATCQDGLATIKL